MQVTRNSTEKLILFAAKTQKQTEDEIWESLDELEELVRTAGGETLGKISQNVESINAAHYLGRGKLDEIKDMVAENNATGVVSDDELSPMQARNLEEILDTKVMDRTMVILDIFAKRAGSKEGKIQVEMAQLGYRLTRLTGKGTELSRLAGGIGTRGPGEQKLETDRRHIRDRVAVLKKELKEVENHRDLLRGNRDKIGDPVVAIVGYTNSGKSTLLNAMSDADAYVEDELFATLDPTTRKVELPKGGEILVTDTVGFIKKLPHHLVKAFYSTLEETQYADVILHVLDASSSYMDIQREVVENTLDELKVADKPTITVLNKMDEVEDSAPKVMGDLDDVVKISAKEKTNLDELYSKIENMLMDRLSEVEILIPYKDGKMLSYAYNNIEGLYEEHRADGTYIKGHIPTDRKYMIEDFLV